MRKNRDKELAGLVEKVVDTLGGAVKNQEEFSKLLDRVIGLIAFLVRSVSIIFFLLSLLIWKVFFWDKTSAILDKFGDKWLSLSEGYQILILGLIGTIIAGIIAQVVGLLLYEKIKSISKKE